MVRGENHIGAGAEQVQSLGEVPGPDVRIPHGAPRRVTRLCSVWVAFSAMHKAR
jgi:hypothetical protein